MNQKVQFLFIVQAVLPHCQSRQLAWEGNDIFQFTTVKEFRRVKQFYEQKYTATNAAADFGVVSVGF